MKFGKIDYINLLPFYVFVKKRINSTRVKKSIDYKKSTPSKINKKFNKREVNVAFISSIESNKKNIKCLDIGILAKSEVKSVLVDKSKSGLDPNSASSNMLAKILKIKGQVIIGDKALKEYSKNPHLYVDLAKEWYLREKLPFVFARLCFNKKSKFFTNLSNQFVKEKIKIPMYILKNYSKQREISKKDIIDYLKLIEYKIDFRAKLSLKKFFKEAKKCKS